MTALAAPTRSFVLATDADAASVADRLAKRLVGKRSTPPLTLAFSPARLTTQTVLDTADRRLREAGLELAVEGAGGGQLRLVLHPAGLASGGPPIHADLPGRARRRYFLRDLPEGRLRDRLAPIVEVRALLPLAEIRRRVLPMAVCNRDGKTVVRLSAADVWVLPAGVGRARSRPATPPVRLAGRLDVAGVLGYPKAFDRVDTILRERVALAEVGSAAGVDEALAAVGVDPDGVSGKFEVDVTKGEPAGTAARRLLVRLADVVEANLPGTLDDLDPEFLHDLRVAVRRSRSVLRELKKAFASEARREQADALRWVQSVTGPTRDLDVQLAEWDELVAHLPAERRGAVDPARAVLVAHRAAAFRTLKTTLRSAEYRQRWAGWRTFLEGTGDDGDQAAGDKLQPSATDGPEAERPLIELAGERIRVVYQRMVRDGQAIDAGSPAETLHDLRKRGKELRYLLELFGGLWPAKRVKPMVSALKGLQDVLGRHQDREVQAASLRALAPELASLPEGAEALLALGALVDRLETEQAQARAEFAARFGAFVGLKEPG